MEWLERRELLSAAPAVFLTTLYHDLLHRAPSAAELTNGLNALNGGQSRQQFALGMTIGSEYRQDEIINDYQTFLNRNPAPAEVNAWYQRMVDGLAEEQMTTLFLSSPEYYKDHGSNNSGWLTGVYHDVLGRAPDTSGLKTWLGQLKKGIAFQVVAAGIVYSQEAHGRDVTQIYQLLLNRQPNASELTSWTAAMDSGLTPAQLTADVAGLPEFASSNVVVTLIANSNGPYAGSVGTAVAFTGSAILVGSNSSTGITYSWTFGDGGGSALQNPIHIYAISGSYTATLTVTAPGGARGAAGTSVVISPPVVYSEPSVAKPAYLTPTTDPTFGTTITRIADDPGDALTTANVGAGTWANIARHVYAKIQPWNSNGTLLEMWNVSSGATVGKPIRQLYLNGNTYQVMYGEPPNYLPDDDRWNPSPRHPDERIAVTNGGQTLEWYNVVAQTMTRQWTLPFAVDMIGSGEGNPSNDGRFILLGQNDPATDSYRMFMVDMDPQGPYAAYPNPRIGPAYDLAADGQMQPGWGVDWVSVSASGKYAVVMYSCNGVDTALRVFDINPNTLALTPHRMTASYPGMVGSPQQGFIYGLGHADLAIDPLDSNQDVIVGTENCGNVGCNVPGIPTVNGGPVGELIMVQLSNGQPISLDDPTNEAGIAHVSTRNLDRPGWVYVSYYHGTEGQGGSRFRDEIVAVKMDGSGAVEQLADEHSDQSVSYYAYPMAVPSPDGKRVLFASNWAYDGNGNPTDYQDYVVDTRALTTPTRVWHQASQVDFDTGVFAGTAVFSANGGLGLAPMAVDDFSESTLSPAWQTTSWGTGSTLTLGGGILSLEDREVLSAKTVLGAAEGRLAFSDARNQYFGLATDLGALAGNYWAVFGTHGTTNWLYALVNIDGKLQDYKLGALPTGLHIYEVRPVSDGFEFYVDGVQRITVPVEFPTGTALKVAMSTSDPSPQPPLQADWVRVDYPPTGTFTSTVFDVTWVTAASAIATWTPGLPAGTTLTVQTRAGDTPTPDATWSSWDAVANGSPVSSPRDRYLQYRVILTTTNPVQTPVLWSINFAWS